MDRSAEMGSGVRVIENPMKLQHPPHPSNSMKQSMGDNII
jgi:hypothetical protein